MVFVGTFREISREHFNIALVVCQGDVNELIEYFDSRVG